MQPTSSRFTGEVFYGGTDTPKNYLKAGTPVVVWIDLGFDTSFTMMIDGEPATMAPRSHVVVAYGYSSAGVLIIVRDSQSASEVGSRVTHSFMRRPGPEPKCSPSPELTSASTRWAGSLTTNLPS